MPYELMGLVFRVYGLHFWCLEVADPIPYVLVGLDVKVDGLAV